MHSDIILQISKQIKDIRKEKKITLQQLADEAGVTKGLISQIENDRTVPSLTVLLGIIKALHIDYNKFFELLNIPGNKDAVLIKPLQQQILEKEYTKGCSYKRIISFEHNDAVIDIVLYKQDKTAKKGYVSTNAYEFNYMISGEMEYTIDNKKHKLSKGDSFYYDARKPHLSKCLSAKFYEMLVIYFFNK